MVKIYTRTGDDGNTSLFGGGRVPKTHARIEAYGTVDELNAQLGVFAAGNEHEDLGRVVGSIQSRLFDVGAHLATPVDAEKARGALPVLDPGMVEELERVIDRLESELEPLTTFILPGGSPGAAALHVARTVCRRAERAAVHARETAAQDFDPVILTYLNRVSDLLFVMARVVNKRAGVPEPQWRPQRP